MDLHCEMIMDEFLERRDTFSKMKDIVIGELSRVFKENDIMIATLEGRVKQENSLRGKLELKGSKYTSLDDITDILGVRAVTFYSDQVDKIAALAENLFTIDWENSVDKRKMLDTDQFGYMSLHYICRIPESLYYDPEHPEINEYRFELQMRTVLQHVWATAYHDTGYKSDIEVPKEYLRAITRLAGVLEIADEQFSSIISELEAYRGRVRKLVKDGNFSDLDLNGDTFNSYLEIRPFDKLLNRIRAINHAEVQPSVLTQFLPVLINCKLKTLGDVEQFKKDYEEDAYRLSLNQLGKSDLEIISEKVALFNLCTVFILKNGGGMADVRELYDRIYGVNPRHERSAARTIEQAKAAGII